MKQWLRAQDKVLQACTEYGGSEPSLPDPIDVDSAIAKLQRDDRAYQDASIAFYRDKPKAIALFRTIAASDGPHRAAARYNIADLLANSHNRVDARKEANAILADPSLASVQGITRDLLGYIANIEDTPEGWTKLLSDASAIIEQPLADIVASDAQKHIYGHALYDIDYLSVTDKRDDWWLDGRLPENTTLSKALVDSSHTIR